VSGRTTRSDAVVEGLGDWGIEAFVHVPSSHVAPVIQGLEAAGVNGILANREEEGVGIAGGLALAGRKVALVIQDNGFGNALTALTTFAKAYHLGLPIVANTRGGLGEYNAMIHSFSEAVPDLPRASGSAPRRSARRSRPHCGGAPRPRAPTNSPEPVLTRADLEPGQHVNAMGIKTELAPGAIAAARVIGDGREETLADGKFSTAQAAGAVTEGDLGPDLGLVLAGLAPGRTGPGEITMFDSSGVAIQDVACARAVWARAERDDVGVLVDLAGGDVLAEAADAGVRR
jgi:sulfopyruvate decarboxylase subunit alpha